MSDAHWSQNILNALAPWKTRLIRDTDIAFDDAVVALGSNDALVEAKRVSPNISSKWTLNDINTGRIATLTYTGIWNWGSNMDTGNYVPEGETAPPGVSDDRMQTIPSYKCDVSFGFDTTIDDTLWKNMNAIDKYIQCVPDFNKGKKPRRSWQDGTNPTEMEKYIVSTKLFTRRSRSDPPVEQGYHHLAYELHPWISDACQKYAKLVPNPDKVRCFELNGRTAARLEDTNDPFFRKNDIVRMTFVIHFNAGTEHWHSEIVPIELMRVGKLQSDNSPLPLQPSFPTVTTSFQHLNPGEEISFFEAPIRDNKRKAMDTDNEDDINPKAFKKRAITQHVDTDAMEEDIPEPTPVKQKFRITLKGKEKEHRSGKA